MTAASLSNRAGLLNPRAPRPDRAARWIAIATAVGFHVVLVALLLSPGSARHAARAAAPIVVDLIASIDPPRSPPRPKPLVKPPRPIPTQVEPPATVTAPADPPAIAAPPAESPLAIVAPLPPEPSSISPVDAAVAPETAPSVPAVPPRFNADYLQNPAPQYPPLARRMREQGKVILRVLVDAAGLAERIELRTSSGSTRLDQSALDTVKRWKFVPARQGERTVAAWVLVPITFTLEN